MALAEPVRPTSHLKSRAAEIVKDFRTHPERIIITQNGEAKMVVIDISQFERQRETPALLKLIAQGQKEFADGKFGDADAFMEEMDD